MNRVFRSGRSIRGQESERRTTNIAGHSLPLPPYVYSVFGSATAVRFLRQGLPPSAIDNDQARLVIGFYCLATLDLLQSLDTAITPTEREEWRKWVWEQQISGSWGVGFRGSPYTNQPGPSVSAPSLLSNIWFLSFIVLIVGW
ncbi:hypothetical protein FRC18_003676 [Serendipita sp. 400]|nr:hypothetical protein FRC18_003676 [Serendipita sp. 400]